MKMRPVRTEEIHADMTNLVVAIRNELENFVYFKIKYNENPKRTRGFLPRRRNDMKNIKSKKPIN